MPELLFSDTGLFGFVALWLTATTFVILRDYGAERESGPREESAPRRLPAFADEERPKTA